MGGHAEGKSSAKHKWRLACIHRRLAGRNGRVEQSHKDDSLDRTEVAGGAPTTAREARALPIETIPHFRCTILCDDRARRQRG
jgi:hypothetical protein